MSWYAGNITKRWCLNVLMHKCPNAGEMLGRIILMHLCGSNSPGSSFYATLPSTLLALFPNLSLSKHYNTFLRSLFQVQYWTIFRPFTVVVLNHVKLFSHFLRGARSPKAEDGSNKNGVHDNDDDVKNSKDDDDGGEEFVQRFLCAKVDLPCVHWL